jgi:outer membrane protein OmpA-like peptidoglycan-associated protein
VQAGLGREDIGTQGVSDSQPLYYEVMPSGEAGNRRAEIYIDS